MTPVEKVLSFIFEYASWIIDTNKHICIAYMNNLIFFKLHKFIIRSFLLNNAVSTHTDTRLNYTRSVITVDRLNY